jgi:hypothetical protein
MTILNLKLTIVSVTLFLSGMAYAQTLPELPTQSTSVSTPSTTPRVKCPAIYFNDQPALTSTSVTVTMGGSTNCISQEAGAWTIVGGAQTTVFVPLCPDDHPYMGGITEQGGGVFLYGFAANMSVSCCAIPNPPVRIVSDHTSWINGTVCP